MNNKNSNALVPTSVSKTCDNYVMPDLSHDTQANSHNLSLNVDVKFDYLNKGEGEFYAYIKPTSRSLLLTAQSVSSVSSNINSVMNEIKKHLTMSNDNTLQATLLLRKNGNVKVFEIHDVKKHGNGNDTLRLTISTKGLHAKGSYATQSTQLMEDSDSMEFQPAFMKIIKDMIDDLIRTVRPRFFSHFPIINGATPITDDDQIIRHLQNGWWRAGQSQDQPFGGRVWIDARGEVPSFLSDFNSPGSWNEKTRTLRIWLRFRGAEGEPVENWSLNQIIIPENLNDAVVNGLRTSIDFRNCGGLACLSVNGSRCGDDITRDAQWNICVKQKPCWINQIRIWNSLGNRDKDLENSLVGNRRGGCCDFRDGNIPPGRNCGTTFSDTQCSGGRCRW